LSLATGAGGGAWTHEEPKALSVSAHPMILR